MSQIFRWTICVLMCTIFLWYIRHHFYLKMNVRSNTKIENNGNFDQKVNNRYISISAIGDILFHRELQESSFRNPKGYLSLWESLIPYLNQSDITYANYEGPSAPVKLYQNGTCVLLEVSPEMNYGEIYRSWEFDKMGIMGNVFNFHESLAKDVKESGIDVVSLANNHILDMCLSLIHI